MGDGAANLPGRKKAKQLAEPEFCFAVEQRPEHRPVEAYRQATHNFLERQRLSFLKMSKGSNEVVELPPYRRLVAIYATS